MYVIYVQVCVSVRTWMPYLAFLFIFTLVFETWPLTKLKGLFV